MRSVLFPVRTPELEQLLADRHAKGLDIRDEEWEGTYVVMTPAPNIRHGRIAAQLVRQFTDPAENRDLWVIEIANVGTPHSYRIPDVTVLNPSDADPSGVWLSTALVVVEIRSPGEPHEEKLPFYASRGIKEVVLVDPAARTVRWLALAGEAYEPTDCSDVLDLAVADVLSQLDWD